MLTRRAMLCQSAAAALAAAAGCAPRRRPETSRGADPPPTVGLDAHLHLESPELRVFLREREAGEEAAVAIGSAAAAIAALDAAGVARALVISDAYRFAAAPPAAGDAHDRPRNPLPAVRSENEYVGRQCALHPERLVSFCSVNPLLEHAVDEIGRSATRLGCRGVKLHLWNSGVNLREPRHRRRVEAALAAASAHGLSALVHLFNGDVPDPGPRDAAALGEMLGRLPSLRVCFAHLGGAGGYDAPVADTFDELIRVRRARPPGAADLWVDLAAVFLHGESELPSLLDGDGPSRLGRQLETWGLSHVLWGSDNVPGYLELTRRLWPLGDEALGELLAGDGRGFVA